MKNLGQIIRNLRYLSHTIGTQELYASINSVAQTKKITQPLGEHILIMSAHPGDEVFACGGAIKKYVKAGKKVHILYFCDGSLGNKSGIRDSSLILKRKKEAREAAKILGVLEGNSIFWGYKDNKLALHTTNIKALVNLLFNIKPDVIFIPSLFEKDSDAQTVNNIFSDVLNIYSAKLEYFAIWMYELFSPTIPNQILDISEEIKTKNSAMKVFLSQLVVKNYHHAMLGLNSYRAQIVGINGFAEAYFSCNTNMYLKLHEMVKR